MRSTMGARTLLVATAVVAFCALGLLDLVAGNLKVGIASLMLAAANGLLLSQ